MDLVQDTVANVIVECVKHLRGLSHHAAGLSCDWWKETFESNALDLQFALHDRIARVGYGSERRRHSSDEALYLRRDESQAGFVHSLAVGLEPDEPVLIDDDLGDLGIADRRQDSCSKLPSEQFVQATLLKLLCRNHPDSPLRTAPLFCVGTGSSIRFSVSSTSARNPRWRLWPEASACLRCASGISGKWLSMLRANWSIMASRVVSW